MNEKSSTSQLLIERQRRCQSVDSGLFKINGTFAHRLKTFAISILPIGFTLTLSAGTISVLQNGSTATATTNTLTIRTEGARCRIELSPILTLLLDGDTGCGYELFHPGKAYIRKSLAELAGTSSCLDYANALTPKLTGQSKTIAGHSAREYKVASACGDRFVWLAADFPDWQNLRDETALVRAKLPAFARFNLADSPLAGMVVATLNVTTNPAAKSMGNSAASMVITNKTTLISASLVSNEPEAFQLPEDYREVDGFETLFGMQTNQTSLLLEEKQGEAERLSSPGIESLAFQLESQFRLRQQAGSSDKSDSASAVVAPDRRSRTISVVTWDNSIGAAIETPISVNDDAFSQPANVTESSMQSSHGTGRVIGTTGNSKPMPTVGPASQIPAAVLNRSSNHFGVPSK